MAETMPRTPAPTLEYAGSRVLEQARPAGGLRFDAAMALLCSWFVGGFYLDAWAHRHIPALETFFTPWHAVLYSGFMLTALFLVGYWLGHRAPGAPWQSGLPAGYEMSLVGVVVFGCSGFADMIWHLIFGIEQSIDALFSPTHLGLIVGGVLIAAGPLRAAWRRGPAARQGTKAPGAAAVVGWLASLPMIWSLTLVLSAITLITQFAQPFVYPLASQVYYLSGAVGGDADLVRLAGTSSVLLQAALIAGLVLLTLRRGPLPLGSLTILLTANVVLLTAMNGDYYVFILTAAVAGVLGDVLLLALRPSTRRVVALRLFAFALPFVVYLAYFVTLLLSGGIWWSIHMWLGTAVMAGLEGLMLSLLLVPPASLSAAV